MLKAEQRKEHLLGIHYMERLCQSGLSPHSRWKLLRNLLQLHNYWEFIGMDLHDSFSTFLIPTRNQFQSTSCWDSPSSWTRCVMSELESLQYLREVCAACTLAHPGRRADASGPQSVAMLSETNCLKIEGNFPSFCPLVNFNYVHQFKPIHRYWYYMWFLLLKWARILLWIIFKYHQAVDNFILKYNFALCLYVTGKSWESLYLAGCICHGCLMQKECGEDLIWETNMNTRLIEFPNLVS